MSGIRVASGNLFFFYAYDAGFEIALEEARTLCEASDSPGIAGCARRPHICSIGRGRSRCPPERFPSPVSGKTFSARRDGEDLRFRSPLGDAHPPPRGSLPR